MTVKPETIKAQRVFAKSNTQQPLFTKRLNPKPTQRRAVHTDYIHDRSNTATPSTYVISRDNNKKSEATLSQIIAREVTLF